MSPPARTAVAPRILGVLLALAGFNGACGARTFVVDDTCEDGLALCGGVCVDTEDDDRNCGQCGLVCGTTCTSGVCEDLPDDCEDPDGCGEPCPVGQAACGDVCADLRRDPGNCGDCGLHCGEGATCDDGACTPNIGCACDVCGVIDLPVSSAGEVSGQTAPGNNRHEPSCLSGGGDDVTYRFVAPSSGPYWFETANTGFDTGLAVLTGCAEVACNDDFAGTDSRVEVGLVAGQEALVVVDGYGQGQFGPFVLRWGMIETGCPDGGPGLCGSCADVVDLGSSIPLSVGGDTTGQPDGLSPSCSGAAPAPDMLHTFRAPFASRFTFDTTGSSFDTVLTVLDRFSCGELVCNDDFDGTDSQVDVDLAAGQEVVVVVDGYDGSSGPYRLNVAETFAPDPGSPPDSGSR